MRMILTLAAVAMLAGCTPGKWNSENTTMSFSFDTGFISRAFSHNGGSKALAPAHREADQVALDGVRIRR